MKGKPILCLDFDGVIHSYTSGWKGARNIPDAPVAGALEFIAEAIEHFELHIFSSRSHQLGGKRAMKRYLKHHLVEMGMGDQVPEWWMRRIFDQSCMEPWRQEVESAADRLIAEIRWPWFKPPALLTLDDRAMTFTGKWPSMGQIRAFRPWNKR